MMWYVHQHLTLCTIPGPWWSTPRLKWKSVIKINRDSLKIIYFINTIKFKFCTPLQLNSCDSSSIALTNTIYGNPDQYQTNKIIPNCYCDSKNYWEAFTQFTYNSTGVNNSTLTYKCVELNECETEQFCAKSRSDNGIIYPKCKCPASHTCRFTPNRVIERMHELLYYGEGCKLYCVDDAWMKEQLG